MFQQTTFADFRLANATVELGGQIRGDLASAVDEPEESDNEFEEFDEDDFDDDFDDDFEQEIEDDEMGGDDLEADVDLDADGVGTIEFED